MVLSDIDSLTKEQLISQETMDCIFDQEDPITKAEMIAKCSMRAGDLKCKIEFRQVMRAYNDVYEEITKSTYKGSVDGLTDFKIPDGKPYENMNCKTWIANEGGVWLANPITGIADILACYHPILPVERLKNIETGEEQMKLAYKRNNVWQEIIVPKTMIANASKIVNLSARGISVTSESSKALVKYLADVENANENDISIQYSTSKLGWIKNDGNEYFIPYDTDIAFDGDNRFKQIFDSIKSDGERETWYSHVKELRKTGRPEVKIMLASSFASILVGITGALPFFVDLWGETEGGKTVSLMLAASVWACPEDNKYIGDYKTTDVALEARADLLNSLPMILDDTSKVSSRIRGNFEGLVYDLCSGKGKSRSNKELGMNRENRWKLCILTNGERPLQSYVTQGGALNRILEIEAGQKIYDSPQETANILKRNYGFAGSEFVKVLREIGTDEVNKICESFQKELFSMENMEKQCISLSMILAADKIATDYLFKDGQYISIEDAKKTLIDKNELSDNERCYWHIIDAISMNEHRFTSDEGAFEKWGVFEEDQVTGLIIAVMYVSVLEKILQEKGFSKKSFLNWASKKNLIKLDGDRKTLVKSINGIKIRCVFLKIVEEIDGRKITEFSEETIPF